MTKFTLEDLKAAIEKHQASLSRWENSTSNNPDKHRGAIRAARNDVERIQEELKDAGVIQRSAQEELELTLDVLFEDARSKEIVEYQGERYQRIFYPMELSRSRKSVSAWGKEWHLLRED